MALDFAMIALAFVFFSILSSTYKMNPLYLIVEAGINGIFTSQVLLATFQTLSTTILIPMSLGDPLKVISIIIGFAFWTQILKGAKNIYRLVATVFVGINLGMTLTWILSTTFAQLQAYSPLWYCIIPIVFVLIYHIYFKRITGKLEWARTIGIYMIFLYIGLGIPQMWSSDLER